jgi:chromosome partitioning protein
VGKTATAVNLGACLAGFGGKALIVDCDPSAGATAAVGNAVTVGLYNALVNSVPITSAIAPTADRGLDLLMSTPDMAHAERRLGNRAQPLTVLRSALEKVVDDYAYVLLDTPSSLGFLTENALAMADAVIAPVCSGAAAFEDLTELVGAMRRVRDTVNPRLRSLAIVVTMCPNEAEGRATAQEIMRRFPRMAFKALVPRSAAIRQAARAGESVLHFAPLSQAARAYQILALELATRSQSLAS